jgi:hypothetical protein
VPLSLRFEHGAGVQGVGVEAYCAYRLKSWTCRVGAGARFGGGRSRLRSVRNGEVRDLIIRINLVVHCNEAGAQKESVASAVFGVGG